MARLAGGTDRKRIIRRCERVGEESVDGTLCRRLRAIIIPGRTSLAGSITNLRLPLRNQTANGTVNRCEEHSRGAAVRAPVSEIPSGFGIRSESPSSSASKQSEVWVMASARTDFAQTGPETGTSLCSDRCVLRYDHDPEKHALGLDPRVGTVFNREQKRKSFPGDHAQTSRWQLQLGKGILPAIALRGSPLSGRAMAVCNIGDDGM